MSNQLLKISNILISLIQIHNLYLFLCFLESMKKYTCVLNRYFKESLKHKFLTNITCFLLPFQANGEASLGKYGGGVVGAAGTGSLFIANHAY